LFGIVLLALLAQSAAALNLYVSPKGSDGWSGCLTKPNSASTDGPLASLAGARDAIRKLITDKQGFHCMICYGDYLREVGYALKKVGIEWDNLST